MKPFTYYAVVRDGVTIYEGMGKQEAKQYAKQHGGVVVKRQGGQR